MPNGKGTPRTVGIYWLVIGTSLLVSVMAYGLVLLPLLGAAYWMNEILFEYALYAVLGFLVLYSIDTVSLLRQIEDVDAFLDMFKRLLVNMGRSSQLTVVFLILIYLYGIVGIGFIGGYLFDSQLGLPAVGLVIALIYPGWDIHNGAYSDRTTIGKLLMKGFLGILHFFGILRDITANAVIQRASPA